MSAGNSLETGDIHLIYWSASIWILPEQKWQIPVPTAEVSFYIIVCIVQSASTVLKNVTAVKQYNVLSETLHQSSVAMFLESRDRYLHVFLFMIDRVECYFKGLETKGLPLPKVCVRVYVSLITTFFLWIYAFNLRAVNFCMDCWCKSMRLTWLNHQAEHKSGYLKGVCIKKSLIGFI